MAKKLEHRQIQAIISSLGESKIINLDASIKNLLTPIAEAIGRVGIGDEVSLHVLCCNEYGLITGLTAGNLVEVESLQDGIRTAAQGR